MGVRTFVGFVADFPAEHNGIDTPGDELARFVSCSLRDNGFEVEQPRDREGWAWDFSTKNGDLEIMSIVGLVGDMDSNPPRQWLVTNDCTPGLFKRLFGGRSLVARRARFLRHFCETLHQIICADSRFSHIVWYNKDTFDHVGDKPGTSP